MSKKLQLGIIIVAILMFMSGCCFQHEWKDATCDEPKTCDICGKTEGEELGHKWRDATCSAPKTCNVCGEKKGEALGHEWKDATCSAPKTCDMCGKTEGEALEHEWLAATCTIPKTCAVCGETDGKALGHTWKKATCTVPKTCTICMETVGVSDGEHNLNSKGKCTACNEQIGIPLTMENYTTYLDVTSSIVKKDSYGRATMCGTSVYPKTNYKFYNVEVKVGYTAYFETEKWEPKYWDIVKRSSKVQHSYTISLEQRGYGYANNEIEYHKPDGFDHTFNIKRQECVFNTTDGVIAISGYMVWSE